MSKMLTPVLTYLQYNPIQVFSEVMCIEFNELNDGLVWDPLGSSVRRRKGVKEGEGFEERHRGEWKGQTKKGGQAQGKVQQRKEKRGTLGKGDIRPWQ